MGNKEQQIYKITEIKTKEKRGTLLNETLAMVAFSDGNATKYFYISHCRGIGTSYALSNEDHFDEFAKNGHSADEAFVKYAIKKFGGIALWGNSYIVRVLTKCNRDHRVLALAIALVGCPELERDDLVSWNINKNTDQLDIPSGYILEAINND